MRRGTSHLNLWSDDARGESHKLGLWGHLDSEFYKEDKERKKRLEACNTPFPEYVLSCVFRFLDRIFRFTSCIRLVL